MMNDKLYIFNLYKQIGTEHNLPAELLYGKQTHAGIWHACSILEHVRWCAALAEYSAARYNLPRELLVAAYWHDIGKVIAPRINEVDITFHDHAGAGAVYLEKNGLASERVVKLVREHGRIIKNNYTDDTDVLLPMLDLCDELSKWSEKRFPIDGGNKQRDNRKKLLGKFTASGVSETKIEDLINVADTIADEIELVTMDKKEAKLDVDN